MIRAVIPSSELSTIVSNIGLSPGFSSIYSSNASSDSGFMMVALNDNHKSQPSNTFDQLKQELPQKVPEVQTFFSSGSIIDSVLNFGLAAPIDVQFSGPHYSDLFRVARAADEVIRPLPKVAGPSFPRSRTIRPSRSTSIGSRRRGSASINATWSVT